MKQRSVLWVCLAGLLIACQLFAPPTLPTASPTAPEGAAITQPPPAAETAAPAPSFTPETPTREPSRPASTEQPSTPSAPALADQFGSIARQHIRLLSEEIGARSVGSPAASKAAEAIQSELQQLGYPASQQEFNFARKDGSRGKAVNVSAVKAGRSGQEIILGAHYDSVSEGHGADDNASGVAVLLEIAERLKDQETPYTIRFIVFGAEEIGLVGSKYYADQMKPEQIQNTLAMVNLDSLIAGDKAYVYGSPGPAGALRDWCLKLAQEQNLPLQTQPGKNPEYPAGTTGDFSDHAPFRKLGIQYLYFEATNWDLGKLDGYTQTDYQYGVDGEIWHTRFDTLSYIDQTFPGRADEHLKLFVTVLYQLFMQYKP